MKNNILFWLCMAILTTCSSMAADTLAAATAAPVRIDARTTQGAKLIAGTERVSPAARAAVSSSSGLTVDGVSASGWSLSAPYYDSALQPDGWHAFRLTETGGTTSVNLLVLNDVVVHGGVLEASETWDDSVVHIVRDWVRVPSGMTLTIGDDAVVKFCPDAGVQVDEGGELVLRDCVLTHFADDTRGGDTNLDGAKT
ncbi:MAG: hypothetical protein J5654_07540, partial [Victivallales bacterium]|nr:hypothetical protein [Victivallales bacterium]